MLRFRFLAVAAVAAVSLPWLAACGDSSEPDASGPTSALSGEEASLAEAARPEGKVLFYCAPADVVCAQVADGFESRYGITAEFIRLTSSQLAERYAAEASSGSTQADVVLTTDSGLVPDAIESGWMQPLQDADLPVLEAETFPSEYLRTERGTATVQIIPWGFAYNTQLVEEADLPKDWTDLLDPRFQDHLLVVDPHSSGGHVQFWDRMLELNGDQFLDGIRQQNFRPYPSAVPATEALAAGEGHIVLPVAGFNVTELVERGAPVAYAATDTTVGTEIVAGLSTEAPHPNAARLFVNYVMTEEGSEVLNDFLGVASPYGGGLPPNYLPPRLNVDEETTARIYALLGL